MRFVTALLFLGFIASASLQAEGTRQVAPNGSIMISGTSTTDIAALHINNPSYNSFGSYDNPNPQSRLYIHVIDPATECIYLGFSWAHNNITGMNPPQINFHYRIKDPNGNVVFGPVTVTPAGANIQNWASGFTGPMQINGAGGYNATNVTSAALLSQGWTGTGDYYIEFRDDENNDLLIDFWDITVADCSTPTPVEKPGRVWSYNWSIFAINDFGFPLRPFNGAFYVCAPDPDNIHASFVTKIDFNGSGFRPAAFNVAFNSTGTMNTGTVGLDRQSAQDTNLTRAEYAIFLNDPIDICETAEVGELSILGISRCTGESYCIKFNTTKAGQIDLLLDFDGPDNRYTPGTADLLLSQIVTQDQVNIPTCLDWNGLDGLGNPLPEDVATQVPITIAYAQGIYHFPIYDAEFMTNGFMIEAVRPASSIPLLFYDDTRISVPSGSGEPPVQLTGCSTPCHRWTNYTLPDAVGFGNLNTINSWWFSQLVIRQDVFFLPSYYSCEIEGPSNLCQGGTSQLTSKPLVSPAGATGGEIVSTIWNGPGIVGSNTSPAITIDQEGSYTVDVLWLTNLGDTCETSCEYAVTLDPPSTASIDTLILQGETIDINGVHYNQGGQYIQELTTSAGCDSILTINIKVLNTVIHYDLNACESFMSNGSHMDYAEFVPSYPQPLSCAEIDAQNLHRNNPQMFKHSCTPGVNNSVGMCVTSLDGCTYIPGHDASVIIEVSITPDPDTAVYLTGFSFFQKAPVTFEWISGNSGPNNYPTWFRVRVLKNGVEIFLSPATPTTTAWNEEIYDFLADDDFIVTDPALFRFELLPYCPVGNGATESVWDLDEIDIIASCVSPSELNKSISGIVATEHGALMPEVAIQVVTYPGGIPQQSTATDDGGSYTCIDLQPQRGYLVSGYKNTGFRNGVTTLDLIGIQKHLLGISPFTSPYQMIAADANKSNNVSAIDLIELRKLILGIYDELPRNTSWRFGNTGQDLTVEFPWMFSEQHTIDTLQEDLSEIDFIGVKIGDVNGDADPDLLAGGYQPRTRKQIQLRVVDQAVVAGKPVRVDFTGREIVDMEGIQFALKVTGAEISGIAAGSLPLDSDHFIITPDGEVRISFSAKSPVSLSPDEVWFAVTILPEQNGNLKQLLILENDLVIPEAYEALTLEKMELELVIDDEQYAAMRNELLPNIPNPFSESTIIRFRLAGEQFATLQLFDISGQLLTQKSGFFKAGINTIELSREELGISHGMVIFHLATEGFTGNQKMILLID